MSRAALHITIGSSTSSGLILQCEHSLEPAFIIHCAAAQEANIMEIHDSAQTVIGGLDARGVPFGCLASITVVHKYADDTTGVLP